MNKTLRRSNILERTLLFKFLPVFSSGKFWPMRHCLWFVVFHRTEKSNKGIWKKQQQQQKTCETEFNCFLVTIQSHFLRVTLFYIRVKKPKTEHMETIRVLHPLRQECRSPHVLDER